MSESIKITTKDICVALELGRHQLRSWTDTLAPYARRETKERSATRYDFGDLLFFATVKHIHDSLGISIQFISRFSESLYTSIREPQDPDTTPYLFISINTCRCSRIIPEEVTREGILVDLQSPQAKVYKYLGISDQQQAQLQLGLVKVN